MIQVDRIVLNIQVHRTKRIKLLIPYIRKIENHENKKKCDKCKQWYVQNASFKQERRNILYVKESICLLQLFFFTQRSLRIRLKSAPTQPIASMWPLWVPVPYVCDPRIHIIRNKKCLKREKYIDSV